MTISEVQDKVREITGCDIKTGTLRRMAYDGLMPVSLTPGGGPRVEWPDTTPYEVAAFFAIKKLKRPESIPSLAWIRPTWDVIAEVRKIALRVLESPPYGVTEGWLPWFSDKYGLGGKYHPLVVTWLCAYGKAQMGYPLDKPARVTYTYTRGSDGSFMRSLLPEVTGIDVKLKHTTNDVGLVLSTDTIESPYTQDLWVPKYYL